MKQTLVLLQEELKREEYKPFAEKMIALHDKREEVGNKDGEKRLELIKQQRELDNQFTSFCSQYLKSISNVFVEEFKHTQEPVQAFIALTEQFIPEDAVLENHLIGQLFNECSEELFPEDEELVEFVKTTVGQSKMANWGLGSSDVVYKRVEKYRK